MWPLGHVAVAYLCYTLSTRWRLNAPPDGLAVVVLAFGAVVPDLVDKPLSWYAGALPTGRTLAHSLVFLIPLCIGLYLLARRYDRGELSIAFAIGSISHALVDALPALWRADSSAGFLLWPLIPVEPYEDAAPSVIGLLVNSLTSPWFHLEFVLAGIALYVWWTRDGRPGLELVPGGARFSEG